MSPTLTRRAAFATMGAAVSTAALAVPITGALAQPESISEKIDRLSFELSEALGEYLDGKFRAIVEPGGDCILQNMAIGPRPRPSKALVAVIEQHRRAWAAFGDSCPAADRASPDYAGPAGEELHDQMSKKEMTALTALCEHPAKTLADVRAKAGYLTGWWDVYLDGDDMNALLASFAAA